LSLYFANSVVYYIDNKSTKCSFNIIVQICANNRHFSVCVAIFDRPTLVAW